MTMTAHFDFVTVFAGVAQRRYARHLAAAQAAFEKRLTDAINAALAKFVATSLIHGDVADRPGKVAKLWYKNANVELFKINYSGEVAEISLDVAVPYAHISKDNAHSRTFELPMDVSDEQISEMLLVALVRGHVSEFMIDAIDDLDTDGTLFSTEADE